jgi:hypothetical protein
MDETGFVSIKSFGHRATALPNIHPMTKRLKYVVTKLKLLEKDVLLDVKVMQIKRYRLRDMDSKLRVSNPNVFKDRIKTLKQSNTTHLF